MYLHLGQDLVVRASQVVAIFDLENATIAKTTRVFLARAQKAGQVVNVTNDLPKSFVLCEEGGQGPDAPAPRRRRGKLSGEPIGRRGYRGKHTRNL